MVLLEKSNYYKVIEPLRKVTINNLFARAIIEKKVAGAVYVDQIDSPKSFYVTHPYCMSLLFGESKNNQFNALFRKYALNLHKQRNHHEWMQAFPQQWDDTLFQLFNGQLIKSCENLNGKGDGKVELNTRVNFKFQPAYYQSACSNPFKGDIKIVRTDKKLFEGMPGSVVPKYFWNNADHFVNNGIGFTLLYKGQIASTAYSAFIHDNQLELGIETAEEFRGKGFAQLTCSALIDYCLQKNYEPVWSCRLENLASYKLAQKLGFKSTLQLPYYRLCN